MYIKRNPLRPSPKPFHSIALALLPHAERGGRLLAVVVLVVAGEVLWRASKKYLLLRGHVP